MIDLKGKTAVVFGLANKRSIAWAIAQKLNEAGAKVAVCYQSERLKREADALLPELNDAKSFQCDVSIDAEIEQVAEELKSAYGTVDIVVHSVAFAPADAIKNDFLLTQREDFRIALDVSAYSLIAVSRALAPLMPAGGSVLTLTYYGSEKVFPNYNVMGVAKAALEATVRYLAASLGPKGIRVNAISAGPIKTLAHAALAISTRFSTPSPNVRRCTVMLKRQRLAIPLRSCFHRWPAASRAKSRTSIAVTT